jgi:hypothetical protein
MKFIRIATSTVAAGAVLFVSGCGSSAIATSSNPTTAAPSDAPAKKESAAVATTAPALTTAQKQAVTAAKGYLALGGGFSRQGLLDQLTSSAGSGFTVADATYAVDSLNTDWNAQAVLAAKGYLKLGSGFSHAGLVQQLSSSAGSKFTAAEAEYATTQVGL